MTSIKFHKIITRASDHGVRLATDRPVDEQKGHREGAGKHDSLKDGVVDSSVALFGEVAGVLFIGLD